MKAVTRDTPIIRTWRRSLIMYCLLSLALCDMGLALFYFQYTAWAFLFVFIGLFLFSPLNLLGPHPIQVKEKRSNWVISLRLRAFYTAMYSEPVHDSFHLLIKMLHNGIGALQLTCALGVFGGSWWVERCLWLFRASPAELLSWGDEEA